MSTSILKRFWREEDGQDMVEYSLLLAFIALAGVTVLSNTSSSISSIWKSVSDQLTNAATTAAS